MPSPLQRPAAMTRRHLLGMAGAGAAVALLPGCTAVTGTDQPYERAGCVPRSSLTSYTRLAGRPLVYEINQRRSSFSFEPGFFAQLGDWLTDYAGASGLAQPDQVWNYGGWTDGGADCGSGGASGSWHHAGRALDLSRLRLPGGSFVSCRYDQWRSETGGAQQRRLREYWSLAASLHLHFAYVLTYLYNAQHHNHIHIDNGRSGDQQSTLRTGSRVQMQAVQAICTHLWGEPVDITGQWDSATRQASRRVLDRLGVDAELDDSVDAWRAFLIGSVPRGNH